MAVPQIVEPGSGGTLRDRYVNGSRLGSISTTAFSDETSECLDRLPVIHNRRLHVASCAQLCNYNRTDLCDCRIHNRPLSKGI